MNLLTVVIPPPEVIADFTEVLDDFRPPPGWRIEPPQLWVLQLASHPGADPGVQARHLERAVLGVSAPRLRLFGAARRERVCSVAVEADPPALLRDLVAAAGGNPNLAESVIPVLRTVRRTRFSGVPSLPWVNYRGPWWQPGEAILVMWEPGRGGGRYVPVHRVPLGAAFPGGARRGAQSETDVPGSVANGSGCSPWRP